MTTTRPPQKTATQKTDASKNDTSKSGAHEPSSLDFISQMVATGLSHTFDSLKEKVSGNITDNGEQYLADALEKLKTAATDLGHWGKKNPVKTTIAVAAVLAVTAFLVSTAKKDAHNEDDDETSGKASKTSSKAKS